MAHYQPNKVPTTKYLEPSWLFRELQRIATAINYIDEGNVQPGGITLTMTSGQGEWRIPIILLAEPYGTTSTTLVNVGPHAFFNPQRFRGVEKDQILLELTAGPSVAGQTMRVELHDTTGAVASTTLSTVGLNYTTVQFSRLPTQPVGMVLKISSSATTSQAMILGASIVIRH